MNYGHYFNVYLSSLGFEHRTKYNGFGMPYQAATGWPLNLFEIEFGPHTLGVIHFQDFVTVRNGLCLELAAVEKFYGCNSNRILVTHWTSDLHTIYHGPVNLIKFSNHNWDMAEVLDLSKNQWLDSVSVPKTQAWQCLNGRMCLHRRRAVDILQNWSNGWLSYGTDIALPRHDYSHYRGCENIDNFLSLLYVYGSAAVNVITETEYDPPVGIVTEKTLMAFAAGQIPVVIGHAGIVQHCRTMGFDMFDDLVDTSYDNLPNDQRVEQAILLNKDLIQGRIDLQPYQQRLAANRQWLLGGFRSLIQNQFETQARLLAQRLLHGNAT